jgi:Glycosyltransferase Family 4
MKKILLLSPYFYPNINPRPYRWTKIAEYWAEQGHEVHVVTEKLSQSPNEKIVVHTVGYSALKSLLGAQRGEVKMTQMQGFSWKKYIFQIINDFFWKKIYFPDDSCIWYFSAKQKVLQLLENQHFDVIISSALPFTAHAIGLAAKKKSPTSVWIADTGDPFALQVETPLNSAFFYTKLNFYLEKKVLQYANKVTFTTENCLEIYQQGFPDFLEKYSVIPPLLTTSEEALPQNPPSDDLIHFAYFGKFYKQVREPKSVVDFYQRIVQEKPAWEGRIKIHIYGDVFDVFQKELQQPFIELHGLIPREKVAAEMQKAHILLNISNITDYQLPSKAPDYLFSGKPIVNIFSAEKDCFAAFFINYPLIFNWKNQMPNVQEALGFIQQNKNKTVSRVVVEELCAPCSLEKISEAYQKLF